MRARLATSFLPAMNSRGLLTASTASSCPAADRTPQSFARRGRRAARPRHSPRTTRRSAASSRTDRTRTTAPPSTASACRAASRLRPSLGGSRSARTRGARGARAAAADGSCSRRPRRCADRPFARTRRRRCRSSMSSPARAASSTLGSMPMPTIATSQAKRPAVGRLDGRHAAGPCNALTAAPQWMATPAAR